MAGINTNLKCIFMKYKILIVMFCVFNFMKIQSQNIIVSYQEIFNVHLPINNNSNLLITDMLSYYIINHNSKSEEYNVENDMSNEGKNTVQYFVGNEQSVFVKNLNKNIIEYNQMLGNNQYIITDSLPNIQWNITKEEKHIANYRVLKATTKFRGRNWEAWFTPDIPVSAGPWKLSGLPGLILQAYDTTKTYQFVAKKINYADFKPPIFSTNKKVALKDFIKLEKENYEAFLSLIQPDRSSNESMTVDELPNSDRELLYEWEEQPLKQ